MSRLSTVSLGDVVRITRYANQEHRKPIWGVTTREDNECDWWFDLLDPGQPKIASEGTFLDNSDTFEIVPPDEVPDHVHAALMRLNLGSE